MSSQFRPVPAIEPHPEKRRTNLLQGTPSLSSDATLVLRGLTIERGLQRRSSPTMLSSTRALVRSSTTLTIRRAFATSPSTSSSAPKPPASRPGPPKLPRAEQREFERLVAAASSGGAFSTPPSSSSSAPLDSSITSSTEEDVHKDARRGPKPDFEGEKNPVTGEIGGPKKDPLLHREWTYGGRATDF